MDIVQYQGNKYSQEVNTLFKKIYASYPLLISQKIQEWEHSQDLNNPFFKFGRVENFLVVDKKEPLAMLSTIIDNRLAIDVALFGFFESQQNKVAANLLLSRAGVYLKNIGKTVMHGPINLSIWRTWRVSFPEPEQPFFLEPFSRQYYKDLLISQGFEVKQKNISTISDVATISVDVDELYFKECIQRGFDFVILSKENFLKYVTAARDIALESFNDSWNFVALSLEEMIYDYQAFQAGLDLSFSFTIQDHDGQSVAFCLAMPDVYCAQYQRLVIKILAVKPAYQGQHLGKAMLYYLYQKARQQGFQQVIFSTMRADNQNIFKLTKGKRVYRYYEAFGKNL
jgi:ribosomal protein S18 acetylase RimI-like enzyme